MWMIFSSSVPAAHHNGAVGHLPHGALSTTEEQKRFQSALGVLLYVSTCTRPDISFAVSVLCRRMQSATTTDLQALKQLIRYMASTATKELALGTTAEDLVGYSDASYADCPQTRRSNSGYVFQYRGGCVSWRSQLQRTVALSTAEAEYMALTSAAQEGMFLQQLLTELQILKATEQDKAHGTSAVCNTLNTPPAVLQGAAHVAAAAISTTPAETVTAKPTTVGSPSSVAAQPTTVGSPPTPPAEQPVTVGTPSTPVAAHTATVGAPPTPPAEQPVTVGTPSTPVAAHTGTVGTSATPAANQSATVGTATMKPAVAGTPVTLPTPLTVTAVHPTLVDASLTGTATLSTTVYNPLTDVGTLSTAAKALSTTAKPLPAPKVPPASAYVAAATPTKPTTVRKPLNTVSAAPAEAKPLLLHTDNLAAKSIAEQLAPTARSKHISVRWHYLRELIDAGAVRLRYVPSAAQAADIMTKALTPAKHSPAADRLLGGWDTTHTRGEDTRAACRPGETVRRD